MERIEYVIVTEEMVWLFVWDRNQTRGFKELLGKDAKTFIEANKSPQPGAINNATSTRENA